MNQEDEVRKTGRSKKPMRTFGDEDLNAQRPKQVVGKGTSAKKVDKAIRRSTYRFDDAEDVIEDIPGAEDAWDVPEDIPLDVPEDVYEEAVEDVYEEPVEYMPEDGYEEPVEYMLESGYEDVPEDIPSEDDVEPFEDAPIQPSAPKKPKKAPVIKKPVLKSETQEEIPPKKQPSGKRENAKKSEERKADAKKSEAKAPGIGKKQNIGSEKNQSGQPEEGRSILKKSGSKKNETEKSNTKKKNQKKSSKKKAQKQSGKETFIRIGRGIRSGSVSVQRYVKGGMSWFDRFVSGEVSITPPKGGAVLGWLKARLAWIGKMGFSSFIIMAMLLMAVILTFFNNTSIAVENVTVSIAGLNSDLEGYTICLISDLHGRKFGTEQATLLRAINGEEYDMMLIAGDMVGKDGDAQPFYDLLEGLSGNKPVYFIAGDSDPGPIRSTPNVVEGMLEEFVLEDWVLGAIDRGAIYLDSPESLTVEDAVIWLTPESMLNVDSSATLSALNKQAYQETNEVLEGLDIGYQTLPFTSYRQQNMTELQERILEMEPTDLHISLAHIPPYSAPRVSDGSDGYLPTVDLLVAGHYCGGVWQLPLIGAVYIPAVEAPRHGWFPAQSEVEGLRMLGSVNMYVSGGLGVTDQIYLPDFRFNNQPKVTLLHLTAKLTDDLLGLND